MFRAWWCAGWVAIPLWYFTNEDGESAVLAVWVDYVWLPQVRALPGRVSVSVNAQHLAPLRWFGFNGGSCGGEL